VRAVLTIIVMGAVVLTAPGCGAARDGSAQATASALPSASPSASPATATTRAAAASMPAATSDLVAVEVTIVDGTVDPPPARVEVPKGTTVRITVASDQPDRLHIHGYDAEVALTPGRPTTIDLVTDQTGLFEVETHEQRLQLFQLVVR
jgi:Cupredoxin-like domain